MDNHFKIVTELIRWMPFGANNEATPSSNLVIGSISEFDWSTSLIFMQQFFFFFVGWFLFSCIFIHTNRLRAFGLAQDSLSLFLSHRLTLLSLSCCHIRGSFIYIVYVMFFVNMCSSIIELTSFIDVSLSMCSIYAWKITRTAKAKAKSRKTTEIYPINVL